MSYGTRTARRQTKTELRSLRVSIEVEGELLSVDAPVSILTEELRAALAEHKPQLLKLLEWERRKLEEAYRRGLGIKWARERGWIALHDPTMGEWHEVKASECLLGVGHREHPPAEGGCGVSMRKLERTTFDPRGSRSIRCLRASDPGRAAAQSATSPCV